MIFKQSSRTDPEQIFIVCRNTCGATLSAGVPVFYEVDAVTDGNSVSQANAGWWCLFAGVTDASLVDDAYGLVQVYGYRESAYASCNSSNAVGCALCPVDAYNYLTDTTSSARADFNFVNLMETTAASGVQQVKVFIRAL